MVHPELEGTVNSIISSIASKIVCEKEMNKGQPKGSMTEFNAENVTYEQLSLFLRSYAPCQIIIDREHSKRINLVPQRLLNTLSYVHNAQTLVKMACNEHDTNEDVSKKYVKLSKLIDISPKAAIPHPQWNSVHDTILVTAIAKHGWIDRDSHCRAIIEDNAIKWGAPFQKSTTDRSDSHDNGDNTKGSTTNTELIQHVADRAAKFLNNEQESIKDCKGFNLNLILKSYSIVSSKRDDETNVPRNLEVDYEELKNSLNTDEGPGSDNETGEVGLPTRKELLRRARILLSRPPRNSNNVKSKVEPNMHNFGVLDQSNLCNTFLAELLREAIKVGQKQQKWIDKLLAIAQVEAEARSQECSKMTDESAELIKISKHITLVRQHSKPLVRAAKNVLRAILGLEVHQQAKANESLFVKERKPIATIPKKAKLSKPKKKGSNTGNTKKKTRSIESTTGDAAVNKALSVGKYTDRNIALPNETFLKLSSIETLMLSVLCSQGMPVCDDDWRSALNVDGEDDEGYSLCWFQTGSVLEAGKLVQH